MAPRAAEPPGGEAALQRRWATGQWPWPWLHPEGGGPPLRVHFAGRWNHGPGPDFRGAILLDAAGRARRGDVELHRRPAGWRSHGHHRDPAYARVLLHVVGGGGRASVGPPAALLPPPQADSQPPPSPPCARVAQRAGGPAVAARLRRLARARLMRKAALLRRRRAEWRARGRTDGDELLVGWAFARALGMPHNAALCGAGLEAVWPRISDLRGELAARGGWQRGRGALGAPAGAAEALTALLGPLLTGRRGEAAAFCLRLADAAPAAAIGELRIPRLIGPTRARQLLADAVYPAAIALGALEAPPAAAAAIERRWLNLPPTRYRRTEALRERLGAIPVRHGEAQALLDLERTRCAQGACAACPLGRLAREHPRPPALIPSPNIHPDDLV